MRESANLLLAGVAAATFAIDTARAETISMSCGAVGLELKICQEGADAWAKKTGNQVKVISTPNSATERLALYQQLLAAKSPDIDVFQIDVIWPGILANHFIDLTGKIPAEEVDQNFTAIIENNTVGGKLVAMPWFTDAGMLLLPQGPARAAGKQPPQTWAGADRDREGAAGQGARRAATTGCGASSSRARPTRA